MEKTKRKVLSDAEAVRVTGGYVAGLWDMQDGDTRDVVITELYHKGTTYNNISANVLRQTSNGVPGFVFTFSNGLGAIWIPKDYNPDDDSYALFDH